LVAGLSLVLCVSLLQLRAEERKERFDSTWKFKVVKTFTSPAEARRVLSADDARQLSERIKPLHQPMDPIRPGDWLSQHKETGQPFQQYLENTPLKPGSARQAIYIQPIGDFSKTQRRVLKLTADFMSRFYCRPVNIVSTLPASLIPARARRTHPTWGVQQMLTTHILLEVLKPRVPADASSYLALTASDLWPGAGWNFVFGQASLTDRVGVWSIYRNGDPEANVASFRLYLLRTLKTAAHETGHMYYLRHCIQYKCGMCGSNNRAEADHRPIALCPQCLAKISWINGCDPVYRFRSLAEFCHKHGLQAEARFYRRALQALLSPGGST